MDEPSSQHGKPSLLKTALRGRCPQCGEGKLFDGFLEVDKRCSECDLDFSFADSGDGPAVFIMLIVGFLSVASALWVELTFKPPLWLHAVIWLPVILGLSLALLRPFKALLIALQFRNMARPGRLSDQ